MSDMRDKAKKLLEEHGKMRGPRELEDWNIKAKTCLVFAAIEKLTRSKKNINVNL